MSATWSRPGQPSGAMQNNHGQYPPPVAHDRSGPPPICFNCGNEGHFVINCQKPKRTIDGPTFATPSPNPVNRNVPGATVTHYPKAPPVVTKWALPGQPPQYGSPASYAPPHQQYSGSAPPSQPYQPSTQVSYPSQQYGTSAPPYSYSQPQQSYSAPSANPQYGHQGYQPPLQNQYSPNGAPQYNSPGYPPQQYSPTPIPYQPPANQYPQRNGSYSVPPPPQWNNTLPVSSPYNAPSPFQQPNMQLRDSKFERSSSGTPGYQPHQQPTLQHEYGQEVEGYQQTPQTPASSHNPHGPSNASQNSPVNESYFQSNSNASVASSRASTPYASRRGSFFSNSGTGRPPSTLPRVKGTEPISLAHDGMIEDGPKESLNELSKQEIEDGEEGEYTEEDLKQEEFNWNFKKIFLQPEPTESVALAQPLSTTYNITPVPLLDPRSMNSVSRYARKENLKEFVRPIRSQPQWSYLQEDPAFSDASLEGPLIPLSEVLAWTAKRHGIEEPADEPSTSSRKRLRSEEQEEVDNQIQLEASEQTEGMPNKRQKNEDAEDDNCIIVDTSGTPTAGTPTIARAGTPCFGLVDDVWAPEPGESASAPVDPTEALLASLGVTGSPKPVRQTSDPPALISNENLYDTPPPYESVPRSMSPHSAHPSRSISPPGNPPVDDSIQSLPQQGPSLGNPPGNMAHQDSPPNGNPHVAPPQVNVPYSSDALPNYGNHNNSMPPQPTTSYGPPQQYGPQGNPPQSMAPQRNPSYGNNQYAPQQQGQYAPPQYGPPQVPPQGQYGPTQGPYVTPQGQYGPPQGQYGPPHGQYVTPQGQYAPLQNQYGPPQGQYSPPQGQYGPLQGQYGPSQGQQYNPPQYGPPQNQYGPIQGQYGPPQGQYGNAVPPQGLQNYGNVMPQHANPSQELSPQGGQLYGNPQTGMTTQGQPQYSVPQQRAPSYSQPPQQGNGSHSAFNNQVQPTQPPRQDSGYVSARGSYSNGSGPSSSNKGDATQHANTQTSRPRVDGAEDTPSPADAAEKGRGSQMERRDSNDDASNESPLSPTSAEILGKLIQPSKAKNGKKSEPARHADDIPARKLKRPQPVVAAAYNRRW